MVNIEKYRTEFYKAQDRINKAEEITGIEVFQDLGGSGYIGIIFYDGNGNDIVSLDLSRSEEEYIANYFKKNRMKELEA